jgi:hypothetical protein
MESRKTIELCNKLYKTGKEQQIFLGFQIFKTRTEGNNKQSKPILETKEANQEKQQKYFWSFCVLESRNKTRTTKKKKESKTWIHKVPT